ncbi:hypothetical protein M231_07807 [Tremella mesenterica]|uniref:Uncharacterized protein n=2 Tax=Tremella mesenterica TaxID=5217 RepID=A0A4Q1BB60_TREME|nr:hypothetical protein M231_07807 [Tremella mesenterica]
MSSPDPLDEPLDLDQVYALFGLDPPHETCSTHDVSSLSDIPQDSPSTMVQSDIFLSHLSQHSTTSPEVDSSNTNSYTTKLKNPPIPLTLSHGTHMDTTSILEGMDIPVTAFPGQEWLNFPDTAPLSPPQTMSLSVQKTLTKSSRGRKRKIVKISDGKVTKKVISKGKSTGKKEKDAAILKKELVALTKRFFKSFTELVDKVGEDVVRLAMMNDHGDIRLSEMLDMARKSRVSLTSLPPQKKRRKTKRQSSSPPSEIPHTPPDPSSSINPIIAQDHPSTSDDQSRENTTSLEPQPDSTIPRIRGKEIDTRSHPDEVVAAEDLPTDVVRGPWRSVEITRLQHLYDLCVSRAVGKGVEKEILIDGEERRKAVTKSGEVDWEWITSRFGKTRSKHQILVQAVKMGYKSTTTKPCRRAHQKSFREKEAAMRAEMIGSSASPENESPPTVSPG